MLTRVKSSNGITPVGSDERYVWNFDQRDLDNSNPRAFTRLVYLDRINSIMNTLRTRVPKGGVIADIGCAQGNVAIQLAEEGYQVHAYEFNESFLNYARKKYDYGNIEWHLGNAFDISSPETFDAVILGELVEHVAHPDDLLNNAVQLAKVGGVVLVTTPNGRYFRDRLPSYNEVISRGDLARIEREQFGPGGEHHLFAYTRDELLSHLPVNARLVSVDFIGTGLFNSHVQRVLDHPRLGDRYVDAATWISRLPGLKDRVSLSLMLVVERVR